MGRHRNVNNPRTISVIVDGDIYDKFINQLPKHLGTSEAIRELINAQVDETEKIKNLNALDHSAIRTQESNFIMQSEDKNVSLDLFTIERRDIPEIIQEIDGKGLLGKLMGDARLVLSCSKRQIENL